MKALYYAIIIFCIISFFRLLYSLFELQSNYNNGKAVGNLILLVIGIIVFFIIKSKIKQQQN